MTLDTQGTATRLQPATAGTPTRDDRVDHEFRFGRGEVQALEDRDGALAVGHRQGRAGGADDAGGLGAGIIMGVDGDVTVDRQRAAVAEQHEALGLDARGLVIEGKAGEGLRAAVEVEDRGLQGIVHDQRRTGVELLAHARSDTDHARIEVGVAARPVGSGRHGHRQDARALLGEVMVVAGTDGGKRTREGRIGIILTQTRIALRTGVDGERTRAGEGAERIRIRHFPGRAGIDDHRGIVADDVGAGEDLTLGDGERTGEAVGTGQGQAAEAGLGQTTRTADDAGDGQVRGCRGDIDEPAAARDGEGMAVRRRAGRQRPGAAGVTERGAVADDDGLGDTVAEGARAGNAGAAEGEDARVDGDVTREGAGAREGQQAGARLDEAGDTRGGGMILDRGADGEAAGIVLVDDDLTRGVGTDLEAAGRAADRIRIGTGDEQAAAVDAEAEVERAEGQDLGGGVAGSLQGEHLRSGGLGLRAQDGVVTRGERHADVGERAGVGGARGGTHAAEDVGRAGRDRAEPVVVGSVGEDRAAGAVDVFGRLGARRGDLGVGRRGKQQGAAGRRGGERTEGDLREIGVTRDDREDAASVTDREVAEHLGRDQAGLADDAEGTAGDRQRGARGGCADELGLRSRERLTAGHRGRGAQGDDVAVDRGDVSVRGDTGTGDETTDG